jgi:hypothetical protein
MAQQGPANEMRVVVTRPVGSCMHACLTKKDAATKQQMKKS